MAAAGETHWLCVSVQSSGVIAGDIENFQHPSFKESSDILDNLVSVC